MPTLGWDPMWMCVFFCVGLNLGLWISLVYIVSFLCIDCIDMFDM